MVIAAHQPEFLPYAGFWHKMLQADVFVILDHVDYKKNSFQNRNRILQNGKEMDVTVPVQKKTLVPIKYKGINNSLEWRTKFIKTIEQSYGKTKYAHLMYTMFHLINNNTESLLDLNVGLINWVMALLGIDTELVFSSELDLQESKTDMLVEMVDKLQGTTYLSGIGGKSYIEKEKFFTKGIELKFDVFSEVPYKQYRTDTFVPNMSVVDGLFNQGSKWINNYIK